MTIGQARARANERLDGMLEGVQDSGDVLGLRRVRSQEAAPKLTTRPWRVPAHMMPALRPGRPMNAALQRTLHVKFDDEKKTSAAEHDSYVTQSRDKGAAPLEPERGDAATVVGAPDFDRYTVKSRIDVDADRPAEQIFTNMPGTTHQRQVTWSRIEDHERSLHKKGCDRVNIRFELEPDYFLKVADDPDCRAGLRALIHRERDRVAAGRSLSKQDRARGVGFVAEDAREVQSWLKSRYLAIGAGDANSAPFKFSTARDVRTHHRGDAELPKELDGPARQRVCAGILAYVTSKASLDERSVTLRDGTVVEGALPVIVVLHPPEAANHPDNWHFHFLFHDRAVAYENDGTAAFAVNKCELTRLGLQKDFREECARLINIELQAMAARFSVSADSLETLGIPAIPQKHLGARGKELEAEGILTSDNLANRTESWRRPWREMQRQHHALAETLAAEDTALHRQLEAAPGSDAEREARLKSHAVVRATSEAIRQALAEADEFRIIIEMTRSGPVAALEEGKRLAARQAKRGARGQVNSAEIARDLHALDEGLRPEREALAACAARHAELVETRRRLINQLQRDLEQATQISAIVGDIRMAADFAATTRRSPSAVHRAVDQLADQPVRIVEVDGLLRFRLDEDKGGIARDLDLSGMDIQQRLQGIRSLQLQELKICAAIIAKHGSRALSQCVDGETPFVRGVCQKWSASRAGNALREAQMKLEMAARRPRATEDLAKVPVRNNAPDRVAAPRPPVPAQIEASLFSGVQANKSDRDTAGAPYVDSGKLTQLITPAPAPDGRPWGDPRRYGRLASQRQVTLPFTATPVPTTGPAPTPNAQPAATVRSTTSQPTIEAPSSDRASPTRPLGSLPPPAPSLPSPANSPEGSGTRQAAACHDASLAMVSRTFHDSSWSRTDFGFDPDPSVASLKSSTTHAQSAVDQSGSEQIAQAPESPVRPSMSAAQRAAMAASKGQGLG